MIYLLFVFSFLKTALQYTVEPQISGESLNPKFYFKVKDIKSIFQQCTSPLKIS